jgi:translation elongation factor EF-1beta
MAIHHQIHIPNFDEFININNIIDFESDSEITESHVHFVVNVNPEDPEDSDEEMEEKLNDIVDWFETHPDDEGSEHSVIVKNGSNSEYKWTILVFMVLPDLEPEQIYELQEDLEEFINEGLDLHNFEVSMFGHSEQEFNQLMNEL